METQGEGAGGVKGAEGEKEDRGNLKTRFDP